jgi:hypothetical protein
MNILQEFLNTLSRSHPPERWKTVPSKIVIESRECIFEFSNVVEGDFTIAFCLSDKGISGKFIAHFEDLWERSGSGSLELINILKKF